MQTAWKQFHAVNVFDALQFEVPPALPYNGRVSDELQRPVDASTRLCAVFGHPVHHSASPAMQNAGIAALALNWRYLAFDVHPDHLRNAIEGARLMGFVGLNLTVPHKLLALEMVDLVDDQAKPWGAVNTIVFETHAGEVRGRGFNTDADAIVKSLQEEFSWESLRAAPPSFCWAPEARRGRPHCAWRAKAIERPLPGQSHGRRAPRNWPMRSGEKDCRVSSLLPKVTRGMASIWCINATSLGLKTDDPSPVDVAWLRKQPPRFVYDMIYRPAETELLRAARSAGCRVANGVSMLLYQGARSLELWTGRPAPLSEMRRALEKNVYG
jgi:shikimate dehydrogenase